MEKEVIIVAEERLRDAEVVFIDGDYVATKAEEAIGIAPAVVAVQEKAAWEEHEGIKRISEEDVIDAVTGKSPVNP